MQNLQTPAPKKGPHPEKSSRRAGTDHIVRNNTRIFNAFPNLSVAGPGSPTFDNRPPLCYEFPMTVEWEGKIHEIDKRLTVARLLDMFSLSKEAHLVTSNGTLATEDRMLERDDRVRIVRVISGG